MKEICFVGGDMRQVRVINKMAEEDCSVKIYGFDKLEKETLNEKVKRCSSLFQAIDGADGVVLPLPYTLGREMINAPFCDEEIHRSEILKNMSSKQILLIGKADEGINAVAKLYGIHLVDYFDREELAVLNAIPTAEGAIEIAMRETPITINQSKCLILGNGRIGKILGKMLMGIGGDVTVCVRKYKDSAYCRANGEKAMFYSELRNKIGEFDIIFNTVPSQVIGYKALQSVRDDSLIIDLASSPGGVDYETAKQLNKRVIVALSLPGKIAPQTAGDFVFETINNILEELGV